MTSRLVLALLSLLAPMIASVVAGAAELDRSAVEFIPPPRRDQMDP